MIEQRQAVAAEPAAAEPSVELRGVAARGATPGARVGAALRGAAPTVVDAVVTRITQLVRLAFVLVEASIALRVLFRVLGANPAAGFDRALYGVTDPLVRPFRPIFADASVNGHPFETGSLVALGFYLVAAWLLVRVVRIVVRG